MKIDSTLARHLVADQFPQWKDLPIQPVALGGWDNRTFHLGDHMLVRLPSTATYAVQVKKEHQWLPKLALFLPFPIPEPVAMGEPGNGYPWKWSIYRWIEGETTAPINDLHDFATSLAQFLNALHRIDTAGGPLPGKHNFYRGGTLATYNTETRQAITILKGKIDVDITTAVWETALASTWHGLPVWVHGDISLGNLLLQKGQLSAVIDFGGLAIGDPACDLTIAWTLFKDESRATFRKLLPFGLDTWARGRAWALWKALIIAANLTESNAVEATLSWRIIEEILEEYKHTVK